MIVLADVAAAETTAAQMPNTLSAHSLGTNCKTLCEFKVTGRAGTRNSYSWRASKAHT